MRHHSLQGSGVDEDPMGAMKAIQEIEALDETCFKAMECSIFQNFDTSEKDLYNGLGLIAPYSFSFQQ